MIRCLALAVLSVLPTALFATSPIEEAGQLYNQTRYREALKALEGAPENHETWFLKGRILYYQGEYKQASQILEKAFAKRPDSASYANWAGKAYGRRAETSSFFTAPGYAKTARKFFERAVELEPKYLEGVSDLFDYYMDAPGFLGGGVDKAETLAQSVKDVDQAEYNYFMARLAEKRNDTGAAEKYYRFAAMLEPRQAGRLLDLSSFLFRAGKPSEAEKILESAAKVAPGDPKVKFARAQEYLRAGQNKKEAVRLLKEYIHSPLTPEDPPRAEAEKLLEQAQQG